MDNHIKALLLGVNLRMREADDGCGMVYDAERQERLTKALDRLTLETEELRPDTLDSMLDNSEEVIEWLAEHPKANVILGYWSVSVSSPEFNDVDFEMHDTPFCMNGAVEDFSKTKSGDGWKCHWALC